VVFAHRHWKIVLDTYTVSTGNSSTTYTRVRALFEPNLPFRFAFIRENVFTRIGKFFGMKDVETGNPLLDRDYLVRTDNESMVRALVSRSRLPDLLAQQPSGKLEIAKFRGKKKPRPERAAELRWQTGSVIRDPLRLQQLVTVFRETLDGLERIGAATESTIDYAL
jgi:hypothetical protein